MKLTVWNQWQLVCWQIHLSRPHFRLLKCTNTVHFLPSWPFSLLSKYIQNVCCLFFFFFKSSSSTLVWLHHPLFNNSNGSSLLRVKVRLLIFTITSFISYLHPVIQVALLVVCCCFLIVGIPDYQILPQKPSEMTKTSHSLKSYYLVYSTSSHSCCNYSALSSTHKHSDAEAWLLLYACCTKRAYFHVCCLFSCKAIF